MNVMKYFDFKYLNNLHQFYHSLIKVESFLDSLNWLQQTMLSHKRLCIILSEWLIMNWMKSQNSKLNWKYTFKFHLKKLNSEFYLIRKNEFHEHFPFKCLKYWHQFLDLIIKVWRFLVFEILQLYIMVFH